MPPPQRRVSSPGTPVLNPEIQAIAVISDEPEEFVQQRLEHERRQRQLAEDERQALQEQQLYNEQRRLFQDEHERRAYEHVTAQRALMTVNRQRKIPSHHNWIVKTISFISNLLSFIGFCLIGVTIYAYVKLSFIPIAANLQVLNILSVMLAFILFLQGMLGNYAVRKPEKTRKWIINLSCYSYLFVTLALMFGALFCLNVMYNFRNELNIAHDAIWSSYANPYDYRMGTMSSATIGPYYGSDGNAPAFPVPPPYGRTETLFAKYFNLIFFAATSFSATESSSPSCQDSLYYLFWNYIKATCPPTLLFDTCAHCQSYTVTTCYASPDICEKTFEGNPVNSPYDKNQGCPYEMCRSEIIVDGLSKIKYIEYGMEAIVGIQITICIAIAIYLWEYAIFYRTQAEVEDCFKQENMQNGVYKYTTDLNDAILRTDMLSAIRYTEDKPGAAGGDARNEHGHYDHTYVAVNSVTEPVDRSSPRNSGRASLAAERPPSSQTPASRPASAAGSPRSPPPLSPTVPTVSNASTPSSRLESSPRGEAGGYMGSPTIQIDENI